MTRTFETTANGRTFTIDETDAGRCAFRIDGERVKASRWVAPHPLVAAAIARRTAQGLGVRIVFSDGTPDFTGYYNDMAKRNRVLAKARTLPNVKRAEIITT